MSNKKQILKELDAAIDNMNMEEIESGLDALSAVESRHIVAEDVKLFSARIKKLDKENQSMNKPRKTARIAVAVAACMLMGITVYAANALNLFSFQQDDKFITMRTTDGMTEEEAKAFVSQDEDVSIPDNVEIDPAITKDFPIVTYDSVEQAQKEMDVQLIIPAAMPDMELERATGQILDFGNGHEIRVVWLNYTDEQGRLFGITTDREIIPTGSDITSYTTHDIDEGSLDSYTSKSGVKYTLLTESDDTGERTAHIATVMIGEYEYSLVFFGFDEAERQAIIDSSDLTVYK